MELERFKRVYKALKLAEAYLSMASHLCDESVEIYGWRLDDEKEPIETFFRGVHKAGSEAFDKLSRKGCNYCLKTNPEYAGYSDIWHGNKLGIGYGNYIEINFCPMCGRYLKG